MSDEQDHPEWEAHATAVAEQEAQERADERAAEAEYRQGLADAAVALRVQALGKLTPSIRDGFMSACNSVIDLRDGVDQSGYADHIAGLRSRLDGEPRRMTRESDGTWTDD